MTIVPMAEAASMIAMASSQNSPPGSGVPVDGITARLFHRRFHKVSG